MDIGAFSTGGATDNNGMGNLADELADAFSDSGDEDEYYEDGGPDISVQQVDGRDGVEGIRDSGIVVANDGDVIGKKVPTLDVPTTGLKGHRRQGSEYDGSEYGTDSDLESSGMLPSLSARIDAVEALARRGTESTGGAIDTVLSRVTDSLKDLGSQTGVEASATR